MEAAKEDVRSDISLLKRAADKAESEVGKAQIEKKRQVCKCQSNLPDVNILSRVQYRGSLSLLNNTFWTNTYSIVEMEFHVQIVNHVIYASINAKWSDGWLNVFCIYSKVKVK